MAKKEPGTRQEKFNKIVLHISFYISSYVNILPCFLGGKYNKEKVSEDMSEKNISLWECSLF